MTMALGFSDTMALRKQLDEQAVAIVCGKAVTRAQLLAAFAVVEDSTNWKNPIDATLTVEELTKVGGIPMVTEAVVFFAGCIPSFDRTATGWRIQAVGYYKAVGA